MTDPNSDAVRRDNWVVMVDARWQPASPEAPPPPEMQIGGWMLDESGEPGPFEPNPSYVSPDDASPTDPTDAVLRRLARGDDVGRDLVPALRDAVVELACDAQDYLLIGPAPDGVPCVAVATAAIHKRTVDADRWWPIRGSTLSDIVRDGVDILLNPGHAAQFRLRTQALNPAR